MNRGYFTFAQNGLSGDYVKLAYLMALSLKATQKDVTRLSVGVTEGTEVPDHYREVFDQVITIPWHDDAKNEDWKFSNEWKAIHMSPYDETIKLDADMVFTTDVSWWWDFLSSKEMANQDVLFCDTIHTYRNDIATSRFYREVFDKNNLPDVYSNMTFFRKTDGAYRFFDMVRDIFMDWERFFFEHLREVPQKQATTDVVYALAAKILDEDYTLPYNPLTFVHMKTMVQDFKTIHTDCDWRWTVPYNITPNLDFIISNYKQTYPVHYHVKEFADDVIKLYEEANV